jgi:hypothetical protein
MHWAVTQLPGDAVGQPVPGGRSHSPSWSFHALRGKSDSIDAIAVARAGLREGLNELPAAQLDGPELDLRLLVDHREWLVRQRVGRVCPMKCVWSW